MITIDATTLEKVKKEFLGLFTETFSSMILRQVNDLKTISGKTSRDALNKLEIRKQTVHPLAEILLTYDHDTEKSLKDKALSLSNSTIKLLYFISDLFDTKQCAGFERCIKSIEKDHRSFFSTIFEVNVAAQYMLSGNEVIFLPEESKNKKKKNDLLIKNSSDELYIECKSLEDLSSKAQRDWTLFSYELANILSKKRLSFKIKIRPDTIHRKDHVDSIRCRVEQAITQSGQRDISFSDDLDINISVENSNLTIWSLFKPELGTKNNTFGFLEAKCMIDSFGNGLYSSANEIVVTLGEYITSFNSIFNQLKTAAKQFPPGKPTAIHIQLPYEKGKDSQSIVDSNFDRLFGKLKKDLSNINAVIISGNYFDMNIKNGDNPFISKHYVIPNTSKSYNSSIALLGSSVHLADNFQCEGTCYIEFVPDRDPSHQTGKCLFQHISPCGKYQLLLWQTFKNNFRVEMFLPDYGRRTLDFQLTELKISALNKIVVSWGQTSLSCSYNGLPVITNYYADNCYSDT